jgi:hypothetical protein
MLARKKFQVNYRRLEEIVVEVDAANEAEARSETFDLVRGKLPANVRVQPRASVPRAVNHAATEWVVRQVIELSMR